MSGLRLIASDLDGTLLGPDGRIAADDIVALRDAHALGVTLVIATGRPIRWLDVLDPISSLRPHVIASNGAVVHDLAARRVLSSVTLAPAHTAELVDAIARAVPQASFGFEDGLGYAVEDAAPLTPLATRHGVRRGDRQGLVQSVGPLVKLIVYAAGLSSDELSVRVRLACGDAVSVTHSAVGLDHGLVEVAACGVDKAMALRTLAQSLGIHAGEVAAFGDMPNDAAMLAWAGHGFAVRDAHGDLAARYPRVESVADGVRALLPAR